MMRLMRRAAFLVGTMFLSVSLGAPHVSWGADGKVMKVLPHLLDQEGRHALSPSLFERDAYQAHLERHPEARSGLRFDIRWKADTEGAEPLTLKVEIRGSEKFRLKPYVLESKVRPEGWLGHWSALTLKEKPLRELGEVMAWRVSLWDQDHLLAERRSFLWQ